MPGGTSTIATRQEADLTEHADPTTYRHALHLTNGDCTVSGLRGTGLAERIVPWRDVLHEGPVPDVPEPELREVRVAFLTGKHAGDHGTAAQLAERDAAVADHRGGEYVLWFEADLYDQLQLIQILAQLRTLEVPAQRVTLICVGEYPGIAHFGGLGQLSSDQLRGLASSVATTLTEAALEYAALAWAAFRATDPTRLAGISAAPSNELRFVAEAFDRLAREYPSTRDGLSLTERRILAAVAGGASTAGAVFDRVAARELRPFLGDTWCFDRIARLIAADVPLLQVSSVEPTGRRAVAVEARTGVRVTPTGRLVLKGRDDHLALNGVDRWIGGVHLSGDTVPWRWDEGTETVIFLREPVSQQARAPGTSLPPRGDARRRPAGPGAR